MRLGQLCVTAQTQKTQFLAPSCFLNKNNYLNFAEPKPSEPQSSRLRVLRVAWPITSILPSPSRASRRARACVSCAWPGQRAAASPGGRAACWLPCPTPVRSQAVRSLGPLRCACYQAYTRGLSTSWSGWDLDAVSRPRGKSPLGGGFALRCFQRLSLLDVATQRWPRQANWRTSGPASSVLSYWS